MINSTRLAERFKQLVEIDSVSTHEKRVAEAVIGMAKELKGEIFRDSSAARTGSDTDNLIIKFKGNRPVDPMLLSGHMDTVGPGIGIRAILKDGRFTSAGDTILGADDKSAIAIILEIISVLQEKDLPHGPLEVVLTTCEEVGLLGAKHLDFDLLDARFGYVLDTTDTEGIVTRAPAANHIEFRVHGKDAHAGVAPERGINAITLTAKAIAGIETGRIDSETTCNIGTIQGGVATNIVPSLVTVKGEVRSHSTEKLNEVTEGMAAAFREAVANFDDNGQNDILPRVDIHVELDFPRTHIPDTHRVVDLARQAALNLGRPLQLKTTGGGADANIFFDKGIFTGVLGTGMQDMHTVRESISLDDMIRTAELVLEIIRLHSQE